MAILVPRMRLLALESPLGASQGILELRHPTNGNKRLFDPHPGSLIDIGQNFVAHLVRNTLQGDVSKFLLSEIETKLRHLPLLHLGSFPTLAFRDELAQ